MHRSTIRREKSPRHRTAVTAAFTALLATAAFSSLRAIARSGGNSTPAQKAGSTCITPLPFADDQHCFGPKGFERLITGEARAVKAKVFDATGQVYEGIELNIHGVAQRSALPDRSADVRVHVPRPGLRSRLLGLPPLRQRSHLASGRLDEPRARTARYGGPFS